MNKNRRLSFSLAINEALKQSMEEDPRVILLGQGVKSPWYVGNTAANLLEMFGDKRIIDTPVSENAVTGAAVGAALAGLKPVVVHPRMDFMLYAIDPIVNEAANWFYMSGGAISVPVVFWGIINRGGEQGAQHSQALHSLFTHIPGLKVVSPACPSDAKGLMIAAIRENNPVVFIDDRWLYSIEEHVPPEIYSTPIGKAKIVKPGSDVTIACFSYLVPEAMKAAGELEKKDISSEVLDLRTLKPIDENALLESCGKTKRLVVCDIGWKTGGLGAEVIARVAESGKKLLYPPRRVSLPDCPAPAARSLESAYYPRADSIIRAVQAVFKNNSILD